MIIIEKTEGVKIPYEVDGNKITFNDEIMFNLERYERDSVVHIDICTNALGCLTAGVVDGVTRRYVAQIDIPTRDYDYIPDGLDENGQPKEVQIPLPFNIEQCTLTLWGLDNKEVQG